MVGFCMTVEPSDGHSWTWRPGDDDPIKQERLETADVFHAADTGSRMIRSDIHGRCSVVTFSPTTREWTDYSSKTLVPCNSLPIAIL